MTTLQEKEGLIPQPPGTFFIGNLLSLGANTPTQDMIRLAKEYGPIYQLDFMGRILVVVSSFELVNELCDDSRFDKKIWAPLKKVRSFAGDGLFTAYTKEPNWSKAHNILLPNFGQRAMVGYHPLMLDIADQLMLKWERNNPDDEIDVVHDMTSLTLDTIGLCGFDYRFNSFYRETSHPFVDAMVGALSETLEKMRRLPIENRLRFDKARKLEANIKLMNDTVDRIIKERRASGEDHSAKNDLLSYMLSGVDKKSGEKLDDLNIRYQVITFLIAGHETTSGLLSFTIHCLLKHPEILAKAYEEVDRVLGRDLTVRPTYQQVTKLEYIQQILKESLRLYPTAPAFALYPYQDTMLAGKYPLKREYQVSVLTPMLHRDKTVWGDDPETFNPDNFSREAERNRPTNAYKPFGNGQRACIGRQFAMQEAALVMGMLLQRFKLIDHTNYQLKIKETLTIKPDNFKIKIRQREDIDRTIKVATPVTTATPASAPAATVAPSPALTPVVPAPTAASTPAAKLDTALLVLFGSNLGTAEEIARQIGETGEQKGFRTTVASLDDFAEELPDNGAVIIVTASYNGTPPDNAVQFYEWLKKGNLTSESLKGVKYTVFGCGNRDWSATFQAVPRFIDEKLAEFGATRLYPRGEGDASDDFDGQFQAWYGNLWNAIAETLKIDLSKAETATESLYTVETVPPLKVRPFVESLGAAQMQIVENRELHRKDGAFPSERSTRHIEITLPENQYYKAGDHLGVIPHNVESMVIRVGTRFGFDGNSYLQIHKNSNRKSYLPVEETISAYRLLSDYVELQDVATRKQIKTLADFTECPPEKAKLLALCENDEIYRKEVLGKHKMLIDLLEEFPACELPFNIFLEMLPPLRPRYYSISSSPLMNEKTCSITVAVVDAPARSGHGIYHGVCSSYLAKMGKGRNLYAFVRDTGSAFRLPEDPAVPVIMVGPGTGIAPFRGFLQERAALKAQGENVGKALLFFGCRHPEQDFIYEQELKDFEQKGVSEVFVAFSRQNPEVKVYVQDILGGDHQDKVWELIEQGAYIYVCGDASKMAPAVRLAFAKIYANKTGVDMPTAEAWIDDLAKQERYLVDVWAAS